MKRKGKRSFTLVEIGIVTVILVMVFIALFMVLNVGQLSYSFNSERIRLNEKSREALYWITHDVRQTTATEILSNPHSPSQISFRVCSGFEGGNPVASDNEIAYTYDPMTQMLIRLDRNSDFTLQFPNMIEQPFDLSELDNGILIVSITLEGTARGKVITVTAHSEIKIRNELGGGGSW